MPDFYGETVLVLDIGLSKALIMAPNKVGVRCIGVQFAVI